MAEELTPKEVGGFRILRRLASGAASDVLLARAEGPHGFQRVVALKILLAHGKADPEFERHFAAEASAYARLSHPAVVKLYDFFAADGQLVMVLEFVDGLPLHKLRAMLAIAGERVDDAGALFLGLRIFSALAAAHGARDPATGEFAPIAHADVNPSNILVPWDGHVKLGDFGIARAAGIESDPRSGFIKGTYGYIAPEQVAGKTPTVRADVYSAGLILWELLARRKAVQRGTLSDAQVLKAMAHPEFPALELLRPDLDAAVRGAVRRALEPDPDKRSITAEEMVGVLRQSVSGEEGRKSLADAIMRVRSAGGSDPLAATTQVHASAGEADGPTIPPSSRGPDSEQTAQFPAVTDEQGDLGKIAFYGRLKLPNESEAPGPVSTRGKSQPPPLPLDGKTASGTPSPLAEIPVPAPSEVTTVMNAPSPVAGPDAPARKPPPVLNRGRLVPRPVPEKHVSNFPTVRAPPLVPEEDAGPRLVAAGSPPAPNVRIGAMPTMLGFAAMTPPSPSPPPVAPSPGAAPVAPAPSAAVAVPAVPAVAEVAAPAAAAPKNVSTVTPFVLAAPAALAASASDTTDSPEPPVAPVPPVDPEPPRENPPHPPPSTERSPEASTPPPILDAGPAEGRPADEVTAAPPPVVGSARPDAPPYAPSALAAPTKRGSGWLAAAAVGLVLAAGGAFFLLRSDLVPADSTATSTAPSAPTPASPASSSPAAAAEPSAPVSATSAEPSAPPPPASAAAPPPSASEAPVASAAPPPSASAAPPPAAAVASVAASAAPSPSAAPTAAPATSEPADSGELDPPASAEGHRIFVDDKVAGEGTAPIHVHCGAHVIRIGSAGKERKVDVPCGGSVQL